MSDHVTPILTFILAIKDPDEAKFEACTTSMAALTNSHRFDLVVVSSGTTPNISDLVRKRLHDIRIVKQDPVGIYQAYNRGLDDVRIGYVMVIGVDDLVLPGLDKVVNSIPEDKKPHLIAACSLMQDVGISKPASVRWGLIFRNWCQQGLLYRSDLFVNKRFDTKYKTQADHKFNMELVSDPKTEIMYFPDVITHFASSGLSQMESDWVFREDLPDIVKYCYGRIFWIIALIKRKLADILKRHKPS